MDEKKYVELDAIIAAFQPKNAPALNRAFEAIIRSVPVADVRPVVRGKWHDHYQMDSEYAVATCSACGISSSFTDMWLPPYCPMCGAEMEEDNG